MIGGQKLFYLGILPGIMSFALDRAHKFFQVEIAGWHGGEHMSVTSFLDYVLVWNPGISYGLFDNLPGWTILAVMALAMGVLAYWWARADTMLTRAGLAIALGGACSHVVDRWRYGAVPDFFHFHWGARSFYVFNLADAAITLGVGLLLVDMLRPGARAAKPTQ
jgi:signal peptidase II